MKPFFFILCLCLAASFCKAQSPLENRIDFRAEQLSLAEALVNLGKNAGIPISFSDNILPKEKKITLQFKNEKVEIILTQILADTDVEYRMVGAQLVLFYQKKIRPNFTISGFVEDQTNGEQLIGANIFDRKSGKGTSCNQFGFYSLTLPAGKIELSISYTGYNSELFPLKLDKNTRLKFTLKPSLTLEEIIVTPTQIVPLEIFEPLSSDQLPVAQMNKLPSLGGEVDLFRIAESMPGVQSGSDGLGGLHVRGGSADQNLILMDGVPIYNPSHSLGIFSVFNSEAIQSVQLSKGIFSAKYGGRLSSVMDVHTREGNMKKWSGGIKAGLIASTVRIEGPIIKDKASILITARRTLLDRIIQEQTAKNKAKNEFVMEQYGVPFKGFTQYSFYDLNAKLNFAIGKKDKFYWSYYTGGDDFHDEDFIENAPFDGFTYSDAEKQQYEWGNQVGVFRWNHLFNDKLFLNTTLTHTIFNFQAEQSIEVDIVPESTIPPINLFAADAYYSTLKDWGGRLDFEYFSSTNHHLRFGLNSTWHTFQPGAFGANTKIDNDIIFEVDIDSFLNASKILATEHNIYVEDEFSIGKKFKMNLGLLGNFFLAPKKNFFLLQPRISLNYQIVKQLSMQAGIGKMAQALHLVTGSDAGFPNDIWLPASDLVPPQESWQGVLGLQYQTKKSYHFSLEAYYKKMDNLVIYLDNSSLREDLFSPSNFSLQPLDSENWESQVTTGEGWAYGLEFQMKKNKGRTTGWLSYTWAFANRRYDEINIGRKYPYRYDRRHNLSISVNHRFTNWLDLSCNWTYGTGLSTLIPESTFQLGNLTLVNYAFTRMPANHRLDAGVNFYFNTWKLDHKIYLGAYNIYNRANPQYYQLKTTLKEGSSPSNPEYDYKIYQGSFLPFLPSVSYSISF